MNYSANELYNLWKEKKFRDFTIWADAINAGGDVSVWKEKHKSETYCEKVCTLYSGFVSNMKDAKSALAEDVSFTASPDIIRIWGTKLSYYNL